MILNVLNTPLGQIATQIVLLTGLFWGGTGLIKAMNLGANALKLFAGGLTTASTAAEIFGAALKSALGIIGILVIAVQAAVAIYDHFNVTLEEQREIVAELQGEVDSLQSEYDELLGKSRSDEGITEAEQTRLNLLKQQLEIKKQILAIEEQEEFEMDTSEGGDSSLSLGQASVISYQSLADSLEWYEEKLEALGPITEANAEQAEKWTEKIEDTQAAMLEHLGVVSDSVVALQEWEDKGHELPPAAQELIDAYNELIANAGEYGIAIETSSDQTEEAADGMQSAAQKARASVSELEALESAYSILTKAANEYNTSGHFTAETISNLSTLSDHYRAVLVNENGQLVVNTNALYSEADALKQAYTEQRIAALSAELYAIYLGTTDTALSDVESSADSATTQISAWDTAVSNAALGTLALEESVIGLTLAFGDYGNNYIKLTDAQRKAAEEAIEQARKDIGAFNAWSLGVSSTGGTAGATTKVQTAEEQYQEALENQSDAFSELNELIEHNIFLKEKNGATEEELIQLYKEYQAQLHQQAEWFRSQGEGEDSEYIRDLQQQWWDLQDTINDLEDSITDRQREAFDDRLQISEDYMDERNELDDWGADNEIAALQRVLDWMDQWYDEGLIDYEYYWDKRVEIAQRKAKAEKEAWEESLNAQIEAYEKQQDAYEALFSIVTNNIQKEIDALEEQKSDIEEKYQQQIDDLQQVNDELEDQIANEEALDALARARQSKVMVYKDGRFQYINDIDQVSEAQANLEKLERDQILEEEVKKLEELRDKELETIDDQIEGWEEYKKEWESVVDDYQEEQDRLLVLQELGIDLEGENWKLRLDNLQSYISQYKALMAELAKAQEMLNQGFQSGVGSQITGSTSGVGITPGSGSLAGTEYNAWANVPGVGFVPVTTVGGHTQQTNLPVGTIIYGDNGAWKVTGGTGGAAGYESEYVGSTPSGIWTPGKGTSSATGSTSMGSSGGGSSSSGKDWDKVSSSSGSSSGGSSNKDYTQSIINAIKGSGSKGTNSSGGWSKAATGTTNAKGGFTLVGEKGPELRVLNSGDGVIPADVTKNLWGWGTINPGNFFGNILDKIAGGTNVTISSLTLPNVHDPEGFIEYFNSAMWRRTLQFQTS